MEHQARILRSFLAQLEIQGLEDEEGPNGIAGEFAVSPNAALLFRQIYRRWSVHVVDLSLPAARQCLIIVMYCLSLLTVNTTREKVYSFPSRFSRGTGFREVTRCHCTNGSNATFVLPLCIDACHTWTRKTYRQMYYNIRQPRKIVQFVFSSILHTYIVLCLTKWKACTFKHTHMYMHKKPPKFS